MMFVRGLIGWSSVVLGPIGFVYWFIPSMSALVRLIPSAATPWIAGIFMLGGLALIAPCAGVTVLILLGFIRRGLT